MINIIMISVTWTMANDKVHVLSWQRSRSLLCKFGPAKFGRTY